MPAPITIPSAKSEKSSEITDSRPQSKKTRVVRRRGRARNGVDSDEEFVREADSDTETDDDDASSIDSESETDTTQSPPSLDVHDRANLDGIAVKPAAIAGDSGPFVAPSNWAEMVANENANDAEDLPVIDFADLDHHALSQPAPPPHPPRARKPKKQPTNRPISTTPVAPAAPASQSDDQEHVTETESIKASTSVYSPREPSFSRPKGQSARQAYQQRLETDPSFVPKVGEFWGHDDRLLDKDLRSLSGWWRGRWQSRGRSRGAFAMRGRGGRGFAPGRPGAHGQDSEDGDHGAAADVPPIDKPWGHDGFEELKRREEQRRAQREQERQQQQTPPHGSFQRGFGFRGRGTFVPRGRGFGRGGTPPPTGFRPAPPFAPTNRPWYAMKPERVWTKQHDAFLYFDVALKPRPGMGQGYRVKLPGKEEEVVRTQPHSHVPSASKAHPPVNASTQDDGEKIFTVRIPRRAGKERAVEVPSAPAVEASATTAEEISIEEIFTVRPHIAPNRRVDLSLHANAPAATQGTTFTSSQPVASGSSGPVSQAHSPASTTVLPLTEVQQQRLAELPVLPTSDAPPSIKVQETVLKNPPPPSESVTSPVAPPVEQRPIAPVLHPLQTTFSPVPQVTPPYGSPYTYGPTLPPGVGLNQHGMPYELATGRPVYIQSTPPPPMFTPRPMMHGHMAHPSVSAPFVPSHMHHPSHSTASPDFPAQPHAHTPPMNSFIDPVSGVPIFTPARQSSRIEIRAPTDAEGKKAHARPSGLRTSFSDSGTQASSAIQQPSFVRSSSDLPVMPRNVTAPVADELMEVTEQPQQMMPVDQSMGYAQYQQPYYYPEQYGYPQYVEMTSQVMHYDVYNADPHPPQPILYY
ncbi:hypothetical protein CERSUDRAFT_80109 [Gelatoporia subvermispora B]|uniref:Btz domain-containing protein n=1 Tax=Ceriporiopsis subvermispora (strain B) TaxID=914234 RepID=M2QTR9_CERS8|nr:hypothetical protein CERSUDRAFT_80109 [Gelatoporia subvermispora B]